MFIMVPTTVLISLFFMETEDLVTALVFLSLMKISSGKNHFSIIIIFIEMLTMIVLGGLILSCTMKFVSPAIVFFSMVVLVGTSVLGLLLLIINTRKPNKSLCWSSI